MPAHENGSMENDRVAVVSENMKNVTLNGSSNGKKRTPLARKQSSPMMPPFMVSAPGKVIVFGEHAVVHGKVSVTALKMCNCDLTVDIACNCCRDLTSIISSRYFAFKIEANNLLAFPRYQSFSYLEHR